MIKSCDLRQSELLTAAADWRAVSTELIRFLSPEWAKINEFLTTRSSASLRRISGTYWDHEGAPHNSLGFKKKPQKPKHDSDSRMPLSITDVFTNLSYRPQLGTMNRNAEFSVMKSDDNNMGSYGYKSPIT